MCFSFGGGGGAKALAAQQQKQADEARQDTERKAAALRKGSANIENAFSGFNDDYFSNLSKSYTDYAMPQLQEQYDEQKKNLIYALARKGNLNSSVYGDQLALLDKQNAANISQIEGTGADYANKARQGVQSARNNVTAQLNSTYDADATNAAAAQEARTLAAPVTFSPLQNLFSNVSALAAQTKLASGGDARTSGGGTSFGARLFGSRDRAGSLVG
jgi:hypothetical protein